VVLGVEEELHGVSDISADVARAVYQLTAWADLDRVSRGGSRGGSGATSVTSGGRTGFSRGGVGRETCRSIRSIDIGNSHCLGHCYSILG